MKTCFHFCQTFSLLTRQNTCDVVFHKTRFQFSQRRQTCIDRNFRQEFDAEKQTKATQDTKNNKIKSSTTSKKKKHEQIIENTKF